MRKILQEIAWRIKRGFFIKIQGKNYLFTWKNCMMKCWHRINARKKNEGPTDENPRREMAQIIVQRKENEKLKFKNNLRTEKWSLIITDTGKWINCVTCWSVNRSGKECREGERGKSQNRVRKQKRKCKCCGSLTSGVKAPIVLTDSRLLFHARFKCVS